jgi:hypothetical protein
MNGSVSFDVEREAHISLDEAKELNRKFEYVDLVRTDRGGSMEKSNTALWFNIRKWRKP